MAVETVESGYGRAGVFASPPGRLSWGAIFGGAVSALGLWLLLYALGLALGLSSMDPADPGSARGAGVFTGIWSLVSPLIALFVGGMVAGRGAGVVTRSGGSMHGLVMWGLTVLFGAFFLISVLGSVLGGVFSAGKAAVGAAGGSGAQIQSVTRSFGLDAEDALKPINDRLQAEGKPTITAEQFSEATKDVVNDAVREGRMNRELLVTSIADKTDLSREDAEEVAGRVEAQFNESVGQVQAGALKAGDITGKVFWGVFGALFLGLISAILGAITGVSRRQVAFAKGTATTTSREIPAPGARREVYP